MFSVLLLCVIRRGIKEVRDKNVAESTLESQLQRAALPIIFCENVRFIGFCGVQQQHTSKCSDNLDII